eukprot:m.141192 g.141192  ORF g.141192 m.141192 type:complete len:487 (+) comp38334_c0_seq5:176-1636(+)
MEEKWINWRLVQWNFIVFYVAFTISIAEDSAMMPQLIMALICNVPVGNSSSVQSNANFTTSYPFTPECNSTDKHIITQATDYANVTLRDFNIAGLLTMALLSALSDIYGRKPVLVLLILGFALDKLGMALSPNADILHYLHAAGGLLCSPYLFLVVAFSAVADISKQDTRSKKYSWLEGFLYLGGVAGPYTGGELAKHFAVQVPYFVASGLCFVFVFYIAIGVTETLPADRRAKVECNCAIFVDQCFQEPETEKLLSDKSTQLTDLQSKRKLHWISLTPVGSCIFLLQSWTWLALTIMLLSAWISVRSIHFSLSLFAKHKFGWGAYETGIYFSLRTIALAIGSGPIAHILPCQDQGKVVFASVFGLITFGIFTFLPKSWMVMAGTLFFMTFSWMSPTLRGTISKQTSETMQGTSLGATGALESVSGVLGPAIMAPVFKWLLRIDYEQYIFAFIGLGYVVTGVTAAFWYPRKSIGGIDSTPESTTIQ